MKRKRPVREERLRFTMDLLGHDVLNNNQAVLSYLELILARPGLDREAKRYAARAASHIRASTGLVADMRTLDLLRRGRTESFKAINLVNAIDAAARELPKYFPEKRISVRLTPAVKSAYAAGNKVAEGLVLNLLVGIARLNPSDSIDVKISLGEKKAKDRSFWCIRVEDSDAELPQILKTETISSVCCKDTSRAVRLAEILFASIASEALGGEVDVGELRPGSRRPGAYLTVCLRRVGKP